MRTLSFGFSLVGSLCLLAAACTQETAEPIPETTGGASGAPTAGGTAGTAGTGSGGTFAGGTSGAAGTGGTFGGSGGVGTGGFSGAGTGGFAVGGTGGGGAGGVGGAGGASAGGTAGGGAGGGGPTVTFSEVSSMINTTCAKAGCHGTGFGAKMPTLTNTNPQTQYQNLTNTMVQECGNKPLVDPGDPANSAILALVQQDCGEFIMPADCDSDPCIPQANIDTLTAWIQGNAPGPQ